MKKTLFIFCFSLFIASCGNLAADVTARSNNLSERRIVFISALSGEQILEIRGQCAIDNNERNGFLAVTCKVGEGKNKKHYLGLSENVTFFAEDVEPSAGNSQYGVIFKSKLGAIK